jgi:hypothetical protein
MNVLCLSRPSIQKTELKSDIKKNQPALNQGSRVDGITQGSLISPKTRKQHPKNEPVKFRPNTMNSSDQSLNHLFIKFTVYSLFFQHKFVMNDIFSIKKCSQHFFLPTIFAVSLSELLVSLDLTKLHSDVLFLNKHSSSYALLDISNVSVASRF